MSASLAHTNALCLIPAALLMAVPAAILLPARLAAADQGATAEATDDAGPGSGIVASGLIAPDVLQAFGPGSWGVVGWALTALSLVMIVPRRSTRNPEPWPARASGRFASSKYEMIVTTPAARWR